MKEILLDIQSNLLQQAYKNEEQIRFSLVACILQSLGWNIWNPMEVRTEYTTVPEEDKGRVTGKLCKASTGIGEDRVACFIECCSRWALNGCVGCSCSSKAACDFGLLPEKGCLAQNYVL